MTTTSALPRYLSYVTLPGWCRAELYEYDSLRGAARDLVDRAHTHETCRVIVSWAGVTVSPPSM